MTTEQIHEQYKVASQWFQTILTRLDQAILPLSKLTSKEIVHSWKLRSEEILDSYKNHLKENPSDTETLEALQFISKVAMGNHRAALRLKKISAIRCVEMIPVLSFPKVDRIVFQGFMPA